MSSIEKQSLQVETLVQCPIDKAWEFWITPEHIMHWNNASEDWYTPEAESDFRVGGRFRSKMSSIDNTHSFDFAGVFDIIKPREYIEYTLGDGRKVNINFKKEGSDTRVLENFEAEEENTLELQKAGWQAILDNYRNYAERNCT